MVPTIWEVKVSQYLLRISLNLLLLAILAGTALSAQLIPIRTVPVASGDQFLTVPSGTLGMGGVMIALDDSLADGWVNPAKGVFIGESSFLGAPTFYGIRSWRWRQDLSHAWTIPRRCLVWWCCVGHSTDR